MRSARADLVLLTPDHVTAILTVEVWIALTRPGRPPILNRLGTTWTIFVVSRRSLVLHHFVSRYELWRFHFW